MAVAMVDFADDGLDDDESPLGDGAAETDTVVMCPYCGEPNEIALDVGGGASQEYEEDCQVCCRTLRVLVSYDEAGNAQVAAAPLDD
jgi:hypothetical protein